MEMFKIGRTRTVDAEGYEHPPAHQQMEKNMERAQAMILGNCTVTTEGIAATLGINVARPW
jgi:hypothetical protein